MKTGDSGAPYVVDSSDAPAPKALRMVVDRLVERIEE